MVTNWMRERGSGMIVFAPAEPSVLRISSPQTVPTILGVPAGRGSAPGRVPAGSVVPGSAPRRRSSPISPAARAGEVPPRVLRLGVPPPLLEGEHLARVVGDELPRS